MRRRRRGRGESQNLDSLLDTMANVTGILVVLLAVTQISVRDAMARLRDDLARRPELSQESFRAAEEEARALRAALAPLLGGAEEQERLRRERREALAGLRTRIASLETSLEQTRGVPRGQRELEARVAAAADRARSLEGAIATEERRVAEAAGPPDAPAPGSVRELRLPDPRTPPPGAEQIVYFVRYGRIFRVDARALDAALWNGVRRATGGATRERLRASALDRSRVARWFQEHDVGTPSLRWHAIDLDGMLVGQLEWRSREQGETQDQIRSGFSKLRGDLLALSPAGVYLHFYVWEDSFETYLAARELADAAGFAAGWTPYDLHWPFRTSLTHRNRTGLID